MLLIKDPRAIRLVERLLDGRITEIKPEIDITSKLGFRYPLTDSILETPSDESIRIMEELIGSGVLKKSFYDKLPKCPSCGGFEIRPGSHCPKCGSAHLTKGTVIEHYACGYVGFEREFQAERASEKGIAPSLTCPKCNKELRQIGVDYSRPGFFYKCNGCEEMTDKPDVKWHCSDCGSTHTHREIAEIDACSYRLNEANRRDVELEIIPKRQIQEYLGKEGYEIQSSIKVMGKSGAEHEIDIFATKKTGFMEHKLIVGISSAEDAVGQDEVLKLYAKAVDIEADDTILVAIPKLDDVARNFAVHYKIKYVEAIQLKDAVGKLFEKSPSPPKKEVELGT